jgi:hypothetical protein
MSDDEIQVWVPQTEETTIPDSLPPWFGKTLRMQWVDPQSSWLAGCQGCGAYFATTFPRSIPPHDCPGSE